MPVNLTYYIHSNDNEIVIIDEAIFPHVITIVYGGAG